jgi:hypothetical protein
MLLFGCSGTLGAYRIWRQGANRITDYSVAIGIPATASVALIVAALIAPNLVAPGRLRFPLNLTLPIAYLPLMLASLVMWTTNRGSIQATPEVLLPARLWAEPGLLAASFASQTILLTLLVAARRDETDDETLPEP